MSPRRTRGSKRLTAELGGTIQRIIESILERHYAYEPYLKNPGDWGERAPRGWIAMELLAGPLGWTPATIVMGEKFDILLISERLRPVITIETKAPDHRLTAPERQRYETRLSEHPTLQFAYLTDIRSWHRATLVSTPTELVLTDTADWTLDHSDGLRTAHFFDPLTAARYHTAAR